MHVIMISFFKTNYSRKEKMVIYLLIDKLEKSIADEGEHDYFKYIT